jgi:hypothetical protein
MSKTIALTHKQNKQLKYFDNRVSVNENRILSNKKKIDNSKLRIAENRQKNKDFLKIIKSIKLAKRIKLMRIRNINKFK